MSRYFLGAFFIFIRLIGVLLKRMICTYRMAQAGRKDWASKIRNLKQGSVTPARWRCRGYRMSRQTWHAPSVHELHLTEETANTKPPKGGKKVNILACQM
jgi:hypothetical protein